MSLSTLDNLVINESSINKVSIGSILKINELDFRTVNQINPIDTTNIHDIFADGSAVATYRLDGNANDLGGRFNGSPTNAVYDLNGKYGRQAIFDGAARKIGIPNIMNFWNVDTTISFWLNRDNNSTNIGSIISRNYTSGKVANGQFGWYLGFSSQTLYLNRTYNGNAIESKGIVNLANLNNKLNNIIVSFKKATGIVDVWVNGIKLVSSVLIGYNASIIYKSAYDGGVTIGANYLPTYSPDWHNILVGGISQMRIFNRVLTDEEALKLYNEKRYIIPMDPILTTNPVLVDTVYSIDSYTKDTFYKDLKEISYDYTENGTITSLEYGIDKKIKSLTNNIVYTCIKPNAIGESLLNKEFFKATVGFNLKNNVLASANGKDNKNYLITEIESITNDVFNINNKNLNGYKYVAKYKDKDFILVEDREPVFTGVYDPIDPSDSRLVLKDNVWYKSNPLYTNLLKNSDFSNGTTDWVTGYRTSGDGTYIAGTPNTLVINNGSVSLGNKPSSNIYNTFIQQELNILKEGYYNLVLDITKTDVNTDLFIITPDHTFVGVSGNTHDVDIYKAGFNAIGKVDTKIWLRPKDKYLVIFVGTTNASDTNYIFKNLKLYSIDEPMLVKEEPLSILGRYLFKNGIPIDVDTRWKIPKVMQEDTLINGRLTTTDNRVWMEIGTVYINQRLVIENPFGNENWKDTDVKAYILHPITKRWEGCHPIMYAAPSGYGSYVNITSEGIIFQSGLSYLYGNDNNLFGGTAPFLTNVEADIYAGKIALIIEHNPKTKNA